MQYRSDVDGLRAVAIVPVVLYHVGITALSGGFVGVDIFFVISGFLITSLIAAELSAGRFSLLSFYERRARRILPALLVMIAVTLVVGAVVLLPSDFQSLTRSAVAAVLFVSNVFFWDTSSYFDHDSTLKALLHTWSLAVEEQYYIAFPFVMMAIFATGRRPVRWLLPLLAGSFALSLWAVSRYPEAAFYLAPTRVWELLLGSLLAIGFFPAIRNRAANEAAAAVGLALIVWCVLTYDEETVFPGLAALWPCLGAVLIIHTQGSAVSRLLSLRPIVFIGLISYSLYLWHWPVIVFARYQGLFLGTPAQIVALILVSTVLAVASWRYIEMPVKTRTVLAQPRRLFGAAATSLVACIGLALGLGLFRQPEAVTTAAFEAGRAEARAAYGEGTCFFSSDAPLDTIDPARCLSTDPGRPDYLLIGDSFAAHLWPGLNDALPNVNLSQFTYGGCRPMLDIPAKAEPGCRKVNEAAFNAIATSRYDVLLVAGRWQPHDFAELERTLRYLKTRTSQVVLFGPMPEYRGNLPELLSRAADREAAVIKYLSIPDGADRALERMAASLNIHYVSLIDLMCPGMACQLYDGNGDPIQWDNAHLTVSGSVQLMDAATNRGEIPSF